MPEGEGQENNGRMTAEEIRNIVQGLLSQQPNQQVQTLMTENFGLREDRRVLRAEVETLKKSQVPEDAIVLTGEDAETYDAFLELSLTPKQITEAITERDTLKGETAKMLKEQQVAAAAEAEGLVPSKLKQLAGDLDIVIEEIEEIAENGEKQRVKRAFVQTKGADNVVTKTRLTEHEVVKEFLSSLKADGQSTDAQGADGKKGTSFVKQGAGGKASGQSGKDNPAENVLSRKYRRPDANRSAQGANQ